MYNNLNVYRCLGSVMSQPREEVDYDQFSEMAGEVTQGTSGETKVIIYKIKLI